ncbi:MAG TPA: amidohydrolase family protein, partial [Labilithrix sp.]|nr:amidohydrolase family protein [Labilithrix sp.]
MERRGLGEGRGSERNPTAGNDGVRKLVSCAADHRLGGCSLRPADAKRRAVAPSDEGAVAELERVIDRPGMRGVMIGCWPNGTLAVQPEDDKLFAALAERDIPLSIHVSLSQAMPSAHKAKLPGYGRFFDAPNRMIELIFNGVFD